MGRGILSLAAEFVFSMEFWYVCEILQKLRNDWWLVRLLASWCSYTLTVSQKKMKLNCPKSVGPANKVKVKHAVPFQGIGGVLISFSVAVEPVGG